MTHNICFHGEILGSGYSYGPVRLAYIDAMHTCVSASVPCMYDVYHLLLLLLFALNIGNPFTSFSYLS